MSHNIGSHVLAKVASSNDETEVEKHKHLFSYLQSRMDHLAEIATHKKTGHNRLIPSSFEYIQDMFNNQHLLCKYITAKDVPVGLIIIGTGKWKGKKVSDIYAGIPNGDAGIHAFYIILENVIRNSLKHIYGEEVKSEEKSFYVGVEEDSERNGNSYLKISLWELLGEKLDSKRAKEKWKYLKEKENNINKDIEASIIDKAFQPREGSWGIAEMTISANYLLCNAHEQSLKVCVVDSFGENKEEPKEIKTEKDSEKSGNLCLMYEFYMEKPRKVLIVGLFEKNNLSKKYNTELEPCGIKIIDKASDISREENKGYQNLVLLKDMNEDKRQWPLKTFVPSDHSKVDETFACVGVEEIKKFVEEFIDNSKKSPYPLLSYLEQRWVYFLCRRHGITEKILLCNNWGSSLGEDYKKSACNTKLITYWHHPLTAKDDEWEKVKDSFFIEAYTAHQQSILERNEDEWEESQKKFFQLQFKSAGLTTVIILDERIQEKVEEYKVQREEDVIDRKKIIVEGLNRVYVPKVGDVNLKKPCWKRVESYLTNLIGDSVKIDSVIIHLGVLEDLVKNSSDKRDSVQCFIDKIYDEAKPLSLSVCTGRGKTSYGDNKIAPYPIVPYSEVAKWVISLQYSSKYQLCQIL